MDQNNEIRTAPIRDENEVFAEWRSAPAERKESLLNELIKLLERHARAVVWNRLREKHPGLVNAAVYWAVGPGAESFRGESKFSTWFHRVVENMCLGLLRKRLAVTEISFDGLVEAGQEGIAESPSRDFERIDRQIELDEVVANLSEAEQQLLALKYEGYSESEIAERLGKSEAALRQVMHRVKQKVARNLAPEPRQREVVKCLGKFKRHLFRGNDCCLRCGAACRDSKLMPTAAQVG